MGENKKYYTPEISEFHIGFEFEWFDLHKWNKSELECFDTSFDYGSGDIGLENLLLEKGLRVKSLGKSDIEEVLKEYGFKFEEQIKNTLYFEKYHGWCFAYHLDTHILDIFDNLGGSAGGCNLVCKNKSELKFIMSRINFEQE